MRKIIAVVVIGLAGLLTGYGQQAVAQPLDQQAVDWMSAWSPFVPDLVADISVSDYVRPADTAGADYASFSACGGDEVVVLGEYTSGRYDGQGVVVGDFDGDGFLSGWECREQAYANEAVSQVGR